MISSHTGAGLEEPKICNGFCVANDLLKKTNSETRQASFFCKKSKKLKVSKPLAIFAKISILDDRGGF